MGIQGVTRYEGALAGGVARPSVPGVGERTGVTRQSWICRKGFQPLHTPRLIRTPPQESVFLVFGKAQETRSVELRDRKPEKGAVS